MTNKIDFKKELDAYRARQGRFSVVDVPDLRYLMIDGHGDPNTGRAFTDAAEALYPLAYRLKFASKRNLGRDYVVMPLEGLWWADDMDAFTASRDKSRWDWTLMIMVPDWIDQDMFADATEQVAAKAGPRRLHEVRLGRLSEGRCVQTLHVGSYDDEADVLARMHHDVHPGQRAPDGRQTPRDLPQRLPQGPAREAPHHPQTAGRPVSRRRVTHGVSRRASDTWSPLAPPTGPVRSTERRRSTATSTPASSRTSRTAPAAGCSPGSRQPVVSAHSPLSDRRTRSTRPRSSSTTAMTPTRGSGARPTEARSATTKGGIGIRGTVRPTLNGDCGPWLWHHRVSTLRNHLVTDTPRGCCWQL